MDEKQLKEFKKELKELLTKYAVSIGFECGTYSDLHGVYDERIAIYSTDPSYGKIVFSVNGYSLTKVDL